MNKESISKIYYVNVTNNKKKNRKKDLNVRFLSLWLSIVKDCVLKNRYIIVIVPTS